MGVEKFVDFADNRCLEVKLGQKVPTAGIKKNVSEFVEISVTTWEAHSTPARSRYGEYKCQNIRLERRAMGG